MHLQESMIVALHMFLFLTHYYLNTGSPCKVVKGCFMCLHSMEQGMIQVIVKDTTPKNFPF